jgi:F-type H+-transporting ATPase subunit beta
VKATVDSTAREVFDHAPVGVIDEVHGPVAVITCDHLPPLRQALIARRNAETYLFEVHQHLDEHHLRAITLHRTTGLRRGLPVYDTGSPLHVPMTTSCLGRVLDGFGRPLDDGPPLAGEAFRNVHGEPLPLREAVGAGEVLQTGIKVIDLLCPFVKGGKTGLFGGAGVGVRRCGRTHPRGS